MKWIAFVLPFIQAECISSCNFVKVDQIHGKYHLEFRNVDENQCFAECHEEKICIAISYEKDTTLCNLYNDGDITSTCPNNAACYIHQRDELHSVCNRYVNLQVGQDSCYTFESLFGSRN